MNVIGERAESGGGPLSVETSEAHEIVNPAAASIPQRFDLKAEPFLSPDQKWSSRATLLFILAVCGGFWALAAAAGALLLG
ncbi:MAG TPA: hypothetical protein VD929_01180 [Caulobacteraceae bacterium]|nr:hypothetical protein [Caulobacteraceae bacterium]